MKLKDFANHNMPVILSDLKKDLMSEPWGANCKILSTYINVNFEIAYSENKVYEDDTNNIAFWKVGNLVSIAGDPLWFMYELNQRGQQKWNFQRAYYASSLPVVSYKTIDDFQIQYNVPIFHSSWQFTLEPDTVEHIMSENKERLVRVFGEDLSKNGHMLFRTILGELELQKKRSDVMAQWYYSKYQFLMPLYLNNPDEVSLTATLEPIDDVNRYKVRTLLYPEYAYPHIRSVVKNRSAITGWMNIADMDLSNLDFSQTE
ncbi:MAG: DUF3825 domain-containing protein [Oscillospiraceae bacterium]|nr:DUF3825 domain-containing protein [Oscillospiraceae bacterium]